MGPNLNAGPLKSANIGPKLLGVIEQRKNVTAALPQEVFGDLGETPTPSASHPVRPHLHLGQGQKPS